MIEKFLLRAPAEDLKYDNASLPSSFLSRSIFSSRFLKLPHLQTPPLYQPAPFSLLSVVRQELEERLRHHHHAELQSLREAHRHSIETLKQQSEQELQTLRFELEDEGKAMLGKLAAFALP